MKVAIKCPACLKLNFTNVEPEATRHQCTSCGEEFPIIFQYSIKTVQDFIDSVTDENLLLVKRDNLGRRHLVPTTKEYFGYALKESLNFELHKERLGEYLLIFFLCPDDVNIESVAFVIKKTGVEKNAVEVIEC